MLNQQIETMIQVADAGSFSKAAGRLFRTPVSVMNQVNALEDRLGVKLFDRSTHGVTLTQAGQSLCRDAKRLLAASDAAIARARRIADQTHAEIRVGTSILRPCKRLLELVQKAGAEALPFRITMVPFGDDPAGLAAMLDALGETCDCFVGPCDAAAWQRRHAVFPIGSCDCQIALPKQHRLAKKKRLAWADLAGETLMLVKVGESPTIDRIREDIQTSHPEIQIADMPTFYDLEAFNACARQGCLMEVPDTWADVHPDITTRPMAWPYTMPLGIIHARTPSPAFADFLKTVTRRLHA